MMNEVEEILDLRKLCYDLYIDCVRHLRELAGEGVPISDELNILEERRDKLAEHGIIDKGI